MMAGVMGVDYRPLTLRQLWIAYQAWLLERWDHTAMVTHSVKTVLATKKINPLVFHPYRAATASPDRIVVRQGNMEVLAAAFVL